MLQMQAFTTIAMTVTVDEKTRSIFPPSVRRKAGIKIGTELEVKVCGKNITFRAVEPSTYKPTKAELAAIREGEAAIARGDSVSLAEFLNDLDRNRRKTRPKGSQKLSR